ncbi:hypothetical protein L1766_07275 [Thermovorax subterraneus]|nr:hypothetical protein [Thermovorax subterraneus]
MSTRKILMLLLIFILTLSLVGCGDQFRKLSPKDAVIKANEKLKEVEGYRMKIDAQITMKDIKQQVILIGEVVNPDQVYLSGNLAGLNIEIYKKENKIFIKDPLNNKWIESENLGLGNMDGIISTPEKTLNELNDMIVEAVYLPDELIEGVKCKVIEYIPDKQKLKEIFFEDEKIDEIRDLEAKYKVWIGEKDFLIRKLSMDLKLNSYESEEQSISMVVQLYDFGNSDIKIEYPKDLPLQ